MAQIKLLSHLFILYKRNSLKTGRLPKQRIEKVDSEEYNYFGRQSSLGEAPIQIHAATLTHRKMPKG